MGDNLQSKHFSREDFFMGNKQAGRFLEGPKEALVINFKAP